MTNAKTTKRALLTSLLSLVLCFTMLLGTTFAWFTDSVTSANNIIKSGNLDIVLEYYDAKNGKWLDVKGSSDILEGVLWEPGYTDVAYLRFKNAGSLALKYQLGVQINEEVEGVNRAGDPFKLSDYIYYDVVDMTGDANGNITVFADRSAALSEVKEAKKLSEAYTNNGSLEANSGYKFIAMVVYMPETVGNEANHNGVNIPKIDLGVSILATQYNSEDDSFGTDYDEDAWMSGMKVYSAQDLQSAINAGEDVVLMNDITLTESLVVPAPKTSTFSLRATPDATVINFNGNKLVGALTKADGAMIVNNGILVLVGDENSLLENTAVNGSSVILNNGNLTINGGTYKGAPTDTAAGTAAYAINTQGAGAAITINDANVIGRGAIGVTKGAKATLNSGTYHTPAVAWGHAVYAVGEGTEVVINGGEFSEGYEASANNYGMYQVYSGEKAKVVINGGNFLPWDCQNGYDLCTATEGTIEVRGGTFADDPSNQNNKNYVVNGFEVKDNGNGTYTVFFPQDSFNDLIDNAQSGDTVEVPAGQYTFPASKLKAGMTLNCAPGTVFEGGSQLNINGASVVGATFSNNGGSAVSQTVNGTFENCTFTGKNGLRYCYAGETVVFENCVFDGAVYGAHFDGGANDVLFKNCTFSGFNAFGSAITNLKMEGCTFQATGRSAYNGVNLWGNTELTDCTFVFDGTASVEWVDLCNDNKTVSFTNCKVNDGVTTTGVEGYVGNYGTGNTIIIDGEQVGVACDEEIFADALKNGETKIYLNSCGTISVPAAGQGKNLTLIGNGNTTLDVKKVGTGGENCDYGLDGSNVVFENLTFTTNSSTYIGYARLSATYKNCTFNGTYTTYANSVFENCTFNVEGDVYNLWTWGAPEVTLTECTFNSDGKAVLLYGQANTKLTVNGCTFNDKGGLTDLKAAIEIGNDYNKSYTLTVNNATVNGYEINDKGISTGTTLWANKNSMTKENLNVVVDGVDVY